MLTFVAASEAEVFAVFSAVQRIYVDLFLFLFLVLFWVLRMRFGFFLGGLAWIVDRVFGIQLALDLRLRYYILKLIQLNLPRNPNLPLSKPSLNLLQNLLLPNAALLRNRFPQNQP